MRASRRVAESKGFTLVELMIVVVIVGVLAAVAIISFRQYVQRSKTAEAYTMLGNISAKQEAYRAEFSQYCRIDSSLDDGNSHPPGAPSPDGRRVPWVPDVGWQQLGVQPDGPVWMGYVVTAGLPGQGISGANPPAVDTSDHWWAARAIGDLRPGGNRSYYELVSGARVVAIINEGE